MYDMKHAPPAFMRKSNKFEWLNRLCIHALSIYIVTYALRQVMGMLRILYRGLINLGLEFEYREKLREKCEICYECLLYYEANKDNWQRRHLCVSISWGLLNWFSSLVKLNRLLIKICLPSGNYLLMLWFLWFITFLASVTGNKDFICIYLKDLV